MNLIGLEFTRELSGPITLLHHSKRIVYTRDDSSSSVCQGLIKQTALELVSQHLMSTLCAGVIIIRLVAFMARLVFFFSLYSPSRL